MAEGGEFDYDDPCTDHGIDHDGDDADEQEVNRTQLFQPGAASTLYHGGEQVQTMQRYQTGLPDTLYNEWTPFIASTSEIEERLHLLKDSVTSI